MPLFVLFALRPRNNCQQVVCNYLLGKVRVFSNVTVKRCSTCIWRYWGGHEWIILLEICLKLVSNPLLLHHCNSITWRENSILGQVMCPCGQGGARTYCHELLAFQKPYFSAIWGRCYRENRVIFFCLEKNTAVFKEACLCICCLTLLMGRNELYLSFSNKVALRGSCNILESNRTAHFCTRGHWGQLRMLNTLKIKPFLRKL